MSAYDRLRDEQWPTGTFGHALPPKPPPWTSRWTPEEQARHVADLLAGVAGWHFPEPDPEDQRLRLITDTDAA